MLLAIDFFHASPKEIIIITPGPRSDANEFLGYLGGIYFPKRVLAVVTAGDEVDRHGQYIPIVENKKALQGRTTAYVCERWICKLPTTDPTQFARQLAAIRVPSPPVTRMNRAPSPGSSGRFAGKPDNLQ